MGHEVGDHSSTTRNSGAKTHDRARAVNPGPSLFPRAYASLEPDGVRDLRRADRGSGGAFLCDLAGAGSLAADRRVAPRGITGWGGVPQSLDRRGGRLWPSAEPD